MAYGILCVHCGWQETNHLKGIMDGDRGNPAQVLEGYRMSFNSCLGYKPEDPAAELKAFENDSSAISVEYGLPLSCSVRIGAV